MRMQEPEQWQQSGQEWQASQEDSEYRAGYAENAQFAGGFESEQQQKIYPQEERWLNGTAFSIFAIILSSIGFFSRGCRDCRVVDRPGIRGWAASNPGGRRDRTGKFHFRCARVYWHFCHCRCYPGAAGKECSQADESQVLDRSENRCIGPNRASSADHLVLRLVASSFSACGYASAGLVLYSCLTYTRGRANQWTECPFCTFTRQCI